ncbi:unnamed protein product [Peniophora sp. CBMAI 1063]|nr:unnamed protein product [Peniophora sp. CBMAI 1063]
MNIDNDRLAALFNECVAQHGAPSVWLRTAIAGTMKKSLSASDAASYRTIGLESVILKMLTLPIHKRLYNWAERHNVFPAAQNGFRHYNAFPSADRNIPWVALQRSGRVGPVIDWVRMLYQEMRYAVRLQDEIADDFTADLGVLIGDPSSPRLWNLFISDFAPPPHPTTPAEGLQAHLNYLQRCAARKQLVIHPKKTKVMIFNEIPDDPSLLWLEGKHLIYVYELIYVGIRLCSTKRNVLALHYVTTATRARTAAKGILSSKTVVGVVLPEVFRVLYFARVDCHTTSAADVFPDVDNGVDLLNSVQHNYRRRAMQLSSHSAAIPLYTDMNVAPMRY